MSRSLVINQPDWLLWVRRDTPQVDTESVPISGDASAVVAEESRRGWQSDLADSISKDSKIVKRTVKIDVCVSVRRVTSPF